MEVGRESHGRMFVEPKTCEPPVQVTQSLHKLLASNVGVFILSYVIGAHLTMAIIDPSGLYLGDRMAQLSDMARLHWPYLYLMGNGYGRFEMNYDKVVSIAYARFKKIPSRDELNSYVIEYRRAHLLFLYKSPSGQWWGQWDTLEKYLPRHKTISDEASPPPQAADFSEWRKQYAASKTGGHNDCNVFGNGPHGKGVGVGVGVGREVLSTNSSSEGTVHSSKTPLNLETRPDTERNAPIAGKPHAETGTTSLETTGVLFAEFVEPQETKTTESLEPQPCADATRTASGNRKPRATAVSLKTHPIEPPSLQEQWFEEFWELYWRRVERKTAFKAFIKVAKTEAQKNVIIAAVKAHAPFYFLRDPEHRPHAATWLNHGRYNEPFDDSLPAIPHRKLTKGELAHARAAKRFMEEQ